MSWGLLTLVLTVGFSIINAANVSGQQPAQELDPVAEQNGEAVEAAALEELEDLAVQAAVTKAAPSIVKIETIGGLEKIGQGRGRILVGQGPTTGLVVSPDGYIISSAFNFAQKPTSILVGLPDGSRAPAELVATDHNCMLTLLKVDVKALGIGRMQVSQAAPENEIATGQWAIAVGRTFPGNQPNVSLGIISAKNRIWGKALQTDAKISPANYGGPLLDIQGRVLGVLVPLSPRAKTKIAGVEWYDSGIGFAVPMDHIQRVLSRLQEGKDLRSGIMGVTFKTSDELTGKPVINVVRGNSPAYEAGIKSGDELTRIQDTPVSRIMEVRQALGRYYGGDTIQVTVSRDQKELTFPVTLIGKLEPFQAAFLGILPERLADQDDPNQEEKNPQTATADQGVPVRYVFPKSPAEKAGLTPGDRIVRLGDQAVKNLGDLKASLNAVKVGDQVVVGYRRGDKEIKKVVGILPLTGRIPEALPPAKQQRKPAEGELPPTGRQDELKLSELPNSYTMYVPKSYNPKVPHGVLIWLHGQKYDADQIVSRWKETCDRLDLILLAPKADQGKQWQAQDVEFVSKMLERVLGQYTIDRRRIAAAGLEGGSTMAILVGWRERELIRGVAAINFASVPRDFGETDPNNRLFFYLTTVKQPRKAAELQQAYLRRLQQSKFPVAVQPLGDLGRDLQGEEKAKLVRWLDSLDRF